MTAQEYLKDVISKYRQKLVEKRTDSETSETGRKYITEDGICTLCGDHFMNHDH